MKLKPNASAPTGTVQTYLGKMSSFERDGKTILRGTKPTDFNDAKSLLQIYVRIRTNNLNAFVHVVQPYLKHYWEQQHPGRYYYHEFLSANSGARPLGFICNGTHNTGGVIVSDYQITQGSLLPISVDTITRGEDKGVSDIFLGELSISSATTLGEFSRAVVSSNGERFAYGDTLSFIMVTQQVVEGLPCARVNFTSILLLDDDRYTFDGLTLTGLGVYNHRLAIQGFVPIGGYAWIHSRPVPKSTLVLHSTQRLVLSSHILPDLYADVEHMREAAQLLGAKIPEYVRHVRSQEDKAVYAAFGVPVKSVEYTSFGSVPSSTAFQTPTLSSPISQSVES